MASSPILTCHACNGDIVRVEQLTQESWVRNMRNEYFHLSCAGIPDVRNFVHLAEDFNEVNFDDASEREWFKVWVAQNLTTKFFVAWKFTEDSPVEGTIAVCESATAALEVFLTREATISAISAPGHRKPVMVRSIKDLDYFTGRVYTLNPPDEFDNMFQRVRNLCDGEFSPIWTCVSMGTSRDINGNYSQRWKVFVPHMNGIEPDIEDITYLLIRLTGWRDKRYPGELITDDGWSFYLSKKLKEVGVKHEPRFRRYE
jgi:hypothetical protein